jgi:hypothetical protein
MSAPTLPPGSGPFYGTSEAPLDVDELVERVSRLVELPPDPDESWRPGLTLLLDDLHREAELSPLGTLFALNDLVTCLYGRFAVADWRRTHPEVGVGRVDRPVFIVGQARTGTTLLHELLATDPSLRAPRTWEIVRPVPAPEPATAETDPRIVEVEQQYASIDDLMPELQQIHRVDARAPEECLRILAYDFRSVYFSTMYHVPSYRDWLLNEADLRPAYAWHRAFLQHLQSRDGDVRWVLKSPAHLIALDALLAEYPDAILVQTHRDPVRVIASATSLVSALRGPTTERRAPADVAAEVAESVIVGLDRSVALRESGVVPADQVVDVMYDDLVRDPFSTVRAVYDRIGCDYTADTEGRLRRQLELSAPNQPGAHRYDFESTGLVRGELVARTRAYAERFQLALD